MKLYGLTLAAILLVGDYATFPSQEEQARISEAYSECMRIAAERIDDGHSDLAVVGKAVAAACKAEFEKTITTLGQSLSAEDREILKSKFSDMQIGFGTAAVGGVRAMHREKPDR